MNFYIADCHFGHKNALNFDHRPFADIRQMEDAMVERWNGAVQKNDTVYILGDFCFGQNEDWVRILERLNGRKVLIEGNHDRKSYPDEITRHFVKIAPYMEVVDRLEDQPRRKVILSHYPIPFYKRSNFPAYYMLCGHVHLSPENDWLEHMTAKIRNVKRSHPKSNNLNLGQIYNVGCMMPWMEYTPRTLDEIVLRWEQHHS